MSSEWKFLSLESISGVREWVHKAHCTHINIPIGLTNICSLDFLFLFIIMIVVRRHSYRIHRLGVQSHGKYICIYILCGSWCESLSIWMKSSERERRTHTRACARNHRKESVLRRSRSDAKRSRGLLKRTIYGRRLRSERWEKSAPSQRYGRVLCVASDKLIAMTICTCANISLFCRLLGAAASARTDSKSFLKFISDLCWFVPIDNWLQIDGASSVRGMTGRRRLVFVFRNLK